MAKEIKNSFEEDQKKDQKFFDDLMEFIGKDDRVNTFFHTTVSERVCKSVLKSGFEYEDWSKTTDQISNSEVDIRWKLVIRQAYGKFTLVFQMSKRNLDFERWKEAEAIKGKLGPNEDPLEILPKQLIKGYFNRETRKIINNPDFDPFYSSLTKIK